MAVPTHASLRADNWKAMYGRGRKAKKRLAEAQAAFVHYQDGSLPRLVAGFGAVISQGGFPPGTRGERLNDIDPDAFRLLVRYGTDFKPFRWPNVPDKEPRYGMCFTNAANMMRGYGVHPRKRQHKSLHVRLVQRRGEVYYVEGVALGSNAHPMLHAWNTRKGEGKAIDWTWYDHNEFVRYLGIPFTHAEFQTICELIGPRFDVRHRHSIAVLRKDFLTLRIKLYVRRLAEGRKRAGKPKAI